MYPRIVSELASAHSVLELSFALTQGRWYSSRWGSPPQPNRPTGAAVHAWIHGNETEVDAKWGTLINSLNGLFCTGMTTVVHDLTSSPNLVYATSRPGYSEEMRRRYSAVGKETVCTENMTPWKKLLPCKQVCPPRFTFRRALY
ncbi:unnamed protein product [Heligmosomoides polygyrus]|uniref:Uncharacterized protein n=1 Tax=Heligmosomoides polygyrus TaxID=6339 RepID=A0A3P8CHD3_HELPZ|nr:unnamed protein product [Heligmosomoides polygyrus]